MPFRSGFSPIAFRASRHFHSSVIYRIANHYETLQIPTNASTKDIKKSFYALSKSHHPDRNPDDPTASDKFVKITEAYAVLANEDKRRSYDNELLPWMQQSHGAPVPRGSYSSSGPAGGRPASGLSRRRTHFRGPPPSFYRNGGWGDQSEKRQAAQDNASRAGEAAREAFEAGSTREEPRAGGMGPGQNPFGNLNDVKHWDRDGHFRTHHRTENRRQRRRKDGDVIPDTLPPSMLAQFFFIGAIISLGVFIPSYIFERMTSSKPSKDKRT